MKQKKGISPLIATVLLIGFTIVLAALVFRFGGNLFRTTTEETACSSLIALQCAQTTDIKIINAILDDTANKIGITIENENEGVVSGFVFVIKQEGVSPITTKLDQGLNLPLLAFNTATYTLVDYTGTELPTIEVTPIIERTDAEGNLCTGPCIQRKEIFKPGICGNNEKEPGEECEIGQKEDCESPPPNRERVCTSQCKWGTCQNKESDGS